VNPVALLIVHYPLRNVMTNQLYFIYFSLMFIANTLDD